MTPVEGRPIKTAPGTEAILRLKSDARSPLKCANIE